MKRTTTSETSIFKGKRITNFKKFLDQHNRFFFSTRNWKPHFHLFIHLKSHISTTMHKNWYLMSHKHVLHTNILFKDVKNEWFCFLPCFLFLFPLLFGVCKFNDDRMHGESVMQKALHRKYPEKYVTIVDPSTKVNSYTRLQLHPS